MEIESKNISFADCKAFCSRKDECWGCIHHPNISSQWSAIQKCEYSEELPGSMIFESSQKYGNYTKNKLHCYIV